MNEGEDMLSVVFLALICIVVGALVIKLAPSDMLIPTFALIAVCLWVAYDYMLLKRYKAKEACMKKHQTDKELDEVINSIDLNADVDESKDSDFGEKPADDGKPVSEVIADDGKPVSDKLDVRNAINGADVYKSELEANYPANQKDVSEFDIALYNGADIPNVYKAMGCSADTKIANRMKYMGMQAKLSLDIRAKHNRHTLAPYYDEELRANENRDWWDVESDFLDEYM